MEKISHRNYYAQAKNRMRRKMLYYGYQMGYDLPVHDDQKGMERSEICLRNVSAWCESKHCVVRKPLNEMTAKELVRCVAQFELVYKSFLNSY